MRGIMFLPSWAQEEFQKKRKRIKSTKKIEILESQMDVLSQSLDSKYIQNKEHGEELDYIKREKIIEIIQTIEEENDGNCFTNNKMCKSMLMDYMVNYPRERILLESALEEGIVEELRNARQESKDTIMNIMKYCVNKLERV